MSAEDNKPKEFDEVFTKEKEVKASDVIEGITEDVATEITKTKGQLEKDFWKAFNKLASQDEYKINSEAWKRRPISRKEHREILSLRRQLEKLNRNTDTEAFMDLEETIYKKFAHYCLVKKDTGMQMTDEEFDNSENEILQRVLDAIFYKLEAGLPFVQQASKTY